MPIHGFRDANLSPRARPFLPFTLHVVSRMATPNTKSRNVRYVIDYSQRRRVGPGIPKTRIIGAVIGGAITFRQLRTISGNKISVSYNLRTMSFLRLRLI
jgi:hypothetical protein